MSFQKARLMVNETPYEDRIKTPISADILSMSEQEVEDICQMEIQSGQVCESKGSLFKGFVLPTNSHLKIDQAYMKLRLMFPVPST